MKRYLEVFCSAEQMEEIKTITRSFEKVNTTPLEYKIFDLKGRTLHYCYLEFKGKEKQLKKVFKTIENHNNTLTNFQNYKLW